MHEARLAAGLIAGGLVLWAGAADAAPATLELAQVDTFLRTAGVTAPWSVQQYHSARTPNTWAVSALTDRKPVGEKLCSTRLVELQLTERGGQIAVDRSDDRVEYAFGPCEWSLPVDYHEIRGGFDPERLQRDYQTIVAAIRGRAPKDVKVTFAEKSYRAAFATLRRSDIQDVNADEDGHLRICFLSDLVDKAGAPETLSVDVLPGSPTEVKVDLCGVIDIAR
jgi:hypothetical protein